MALVVQGGFRKATRAQARRWSTPRPGSNRVGNRRIVGKGEQTEPEPGLFVRWIQACDLLYRVPEIEGVRLHDAG